MNESVKVIDLTRAAAFDGIICTVSTKSGPFRVSFDGDKHATTSGAIRSSLTEEEYRKICLTVKVVWMITMPNRDITRRTHYE